MTGSAGDVSGGWWGRGAKEADSSVARTDLGKCERLCLDGRCDWVVHADNADVLPALPDGFFRLIYIDPPFNTGKVQERKEIATVRSGDGDRVGFGGRRYRTIELGTTSYEDSFDNYLAFIGPRLEHARRLLTEDGTLYLHLDQREAHYCKVLLDRIFGRECFVNEITWAYDYGGRSRRKWPAKHDTILVYARDPDRYFFDQDAIERIPYMAPGLVSKAKAARGKLPTDVWWHTIVPTNGKEKTGYASQKPEGILRRILSASSQPDDWVLDFFAGSGTTAAVARKMGRRFVMVDRNDEAIAVMAKRLGAVNVGYVDGRFRPLAIRPDGSEPARCAVTENRGSGSAPGGRWARTCRL